MVTRSLFPLQSTSTSSRERLVRVLFLLTLGLLAASLTTSKVPTVHAAGAGAVVTPEDVATRLGRPPNFLIGMGNDLANDHSQDGAYTLGVTLDLHYAYLVGLPGYGGWPDWNAGGTFVNILTDSADAQGVVPMFTFYQMAAWGEGNISVLTNADFMGRYWSGARLLFQRLAVFNKPAVVHLEPDFWAFAQHQNPNPAAISAQVKAHAPECADLPNDLTGVGRCLVRMARTISPKVVIGFHASAWAGTPQATASFLNALGSADADIVVVDALDRDAGCFEAGIDPNCQRNDGPWYWDETNTTSPNFHEHLAWARAIHEGTGRPILWWQMPFGVPSNQPGGTPNRYRDNRVRYLFAHPDEFVAAGGVGAVFGTGAANQTYIDTDGGQDGGQFRNAVHAYFASPTSLLLTSTAAALAIADGAGNGNSILEANETVEVRTSWRANEDVLGLSGLSVAGPDFTLVDGSATYGNVSAGSTRSCAANLDCYWVTADGVRPTTHWDLALKETLSSGPTHSWPLHVGASFNDVPSTNALYPFVETLLHNGVTSGCSATSYCPSSTTTRAQMSVFVLKAREGAGYTPPACAGGGEIFSDVPATSPFCPFVEELSRRGVVSGCGGGRYCPNNAVTRAQMAPFTLKTLEGTSYSPPACTAGAERFADVPAGDPFCRWIEEYERRGITSGCSTTRYCPNSPVTRGQMAVFQTLTFGLLVNTP